MTLPVLPWWCPLPGTHLCPGSINNNLPLMGGRIPLVSKYLVSSAKEGFKNESSSRSWGSCWIPAAFSLEEAVPMQISSQWDEEDGASSPDLTVKSLLCCRDFPD